MPTLVDILRYQVVLDDKGFTGPAQGVDAVVNRMAGSIGGALTGALGLLAGAFSAVKIGEFLKDATLTAARTEVLGTVLTQVGRNAGVSQGELSLLEEQVKSLGITTQGARESIIKFIQSGLPLTKVAELARLAQDSAVVAGINSAEALDRLVRGIQTGQIELLRSAGVFVSIEQELNKFAKSTGKAREGLTDLERQTVILNAVLAQGDKLAGNYEASMGDVGKQLTSLPRFFEELENAIGSFFLPVMEDAVSTTTDFLKIITELLTNEAILNARKATVAEEETKRQSALNDLYAERGRLTGLILQNELLTQSVTMPSIAKLMEEQGKAFDGLSESQRLLQQALVFSSTLTAGGVGALAKLSEKGLSYVVAKQKRDLEEVQRLIDGLEQTFKKTFDLQMPSGPGSAIDAFDKREAERAKRAAERGKELAKTITVGGDIAEGLDREWQKFLATVTNQPIEAQVKITIPTAEQAQIRGQIEEIFRSNAPDQGPMFDILDIQNQIAGANLLADKAKEAAQVTQREFANAFDDVFTVASSVLRNIGNEAADVFGGMLASIGNLSTGNIAAGIAGVVDSIFSIFGAGADRLVLSQRDLIRAIEDWQQTVSSISDRDKAEQENAITRALQFADRAAARGDNQALTRSIIEQMLAAAGINAPENATLTQLVAFMQALQLSLSDTTRTFESIIGATTAGQRTGLVTGTTGADEALRIINTLTDIFDLNLEEQRDLLQAAFDDLVARGLLSDQDKADFFSRIEGLGDSIDNLAEKEGATQVERSIARVSERQADSLISIMNTLDLHLVDGLNTVINYLQGLFDIGQQMIAGATVGGGVYTIEITNNFSGGNQAEIESTVSKAVEKGIRAVGGTRIGSR